MGVGSLDLALNFGQDQVVFACLKADIKACSANVGGKKCFFEKMIHLLSVKSTFFRSTIAVNV